MLRLCWFTFVGGRCYAARGRLPRCCAPQDQASAFLASEPGPPCYRNCCEFDRRSRAGLDELTSCRPFRQVRVVPEQLRRPRHRNRIERKGAALAEGVCRPATVRPAAAAVPITGMAVNIVVTQMAPSQPHHGRSASPASRGRGTSLRTTPISRTSAIDRVATEKLTAPTTNGAPISVRSSLLMPPYTGRTAPASSASRTQPSLANDSSLVACFWPSTIAAAPAKAARKPASPPALLRHAKDTERIEAQRRERLTGDEQADRHWKQDDG
jgi:hypothetical protein